MPLQFVSAFASAICYRRPTCISLLVLVIVLWLPINWCIPLCETILYHSIRLYPEFWLVYLPENNWVQIIFWACAIKKLNSVWLIKIQYVKKTFYNFKHFNYCMNDKSIIELGYHKISRFVSVSVARHWQIMIFCSNSSNN